MDCKLILNQILNNNRILCELLEEEEEAENDEITFITHKRKPIILIFNKET